MLKALYSRFDQSNRSKKCYKKNTFSVIFWLSMKIYQTYKEQ